LDRCFQQPSGKSTIFRDFSEFRARRRLFGLADHDRGSILLASACSRPETLPLVMASCFRDANGSNTAKDRSEEEEAPPALGLRVGRRLSDLCTSKGITRMSPVDGRSNGRVNQQPARGVLGITTLIVIFDVKPCDECTGSNRAVYGAGANRAAMMASSTF
jgi:hypothetical protein